MLFRATLRIALLFFVALTLIGVDLENLNVVAVLIAAIMILLTCFGNF